MYFTINCILGDGWLVVAVKQTDFLKEACMFRNHLSKTNFILYYVPAVIFYQLAVND